MALKELFELQRGQELKATFGLHQSGWSSPGLSKINALLNRLYPDPADSSLASGAAFASTQPLSEGEKEQKRAFWYAELLLQAVALLTEVSESSELRIRVRDQLARPLLIALQADQNTWGALLAIVMPERYLGFDRKAVWDAGTQVSGAGQNRTGFAFVGNSFYFLAKDNTLRSVVISDAWRVTSASAALPALATPEAAVAEDTASARLKSKLQNFVQGSLATFHQKVDALARSDYDNLPHSSVGIENLAGSLGDIIPSDLTPLDSATKLGVIAKENIHVYVVHDRSLVREEVRRVSSPQVTYFFSQHGNASVSVSDSNKLGPGYDQATFVSPVDYPCAVRQVSFSPDENHAFVLLVNGQLQLLRKSTSVQWEVLERTRPPTGGEPHISSIQYLSSEYCIVMFDCNLPYCGALYALNRSNTGYGYILCDSRHNVIKNDPGFFGSVMQRKPSYTHCHSIPFVKQDSVLAGFMIYFYAKHTWVCHYVWINNQCIFQAPIQMEPNKAPSGASWSSPHNALAIRFLDGSLSLVRFDKDYKKIMSKICLNANGDHPRMMSI